MSNLVDPKLKKPTLKKFELSENSSNLKQKMYVFTILCIILKYVQTKIRNRQ